jgi:hypothetical protein
MQTTRPVRILRVLQQGEVQRLGGSEIIPVDVRILAATNKVLEAAIQAGAFREDLYYRLSVVSLRLPPLRERREGIPELAEYFLARYTPPGAAQPTLEAAALQKLEAHAWPGNVRELENMIRQALVAAKGLAILAMDVLLGEPVAQGNQVQAAHWLGISRSTLSCTVGGRYCYTGRRRNGRRGRGRRPAPRSWSAGHPKLQVSNPVQVRQLRQPAAPEYPISELRLRVGTIVALKAIVL